MSFPTESSAKSIARDVIEEVKQELGQDWLKVKGIGLAKPDYMDSWLDSLVTNSDQRSDLDALKAALAYWQSDAFDAWLADVTGLPCFCQNDAAAAATSELLLAPKPPSKDFFYLFVSTACGGSLVANGECYFGANGKAGSFGLIPTTTGKHGQWVLEALSLSSLHRYFMAKGIIWPEQDHDWLQPSYRIDIECWAMEVAEEVKAALVSVIALYDPQVILIGGRLPEVVLTQLIMALRQVVSANIVLPMPDIQIAQTGYTAGVLGAAVLPLYETFAPQKNVLLLSSKEA